MARRLVVVSSVVASSIVASCAIAWIVVFKPIFDVETKVRSQLKDPESAMFSKVTFNTKTKAGCGYVNAKNSLGGYIGKSHFVLLEDGDLKLSPLGREGEGTFEQQLEYLKKNLEYTKFAGMYCKE